MIRFPRAARLSLAVLLVTAGSAAAATITVDATADDLDAGPNGNCTLREALLAANSNAAVDACAAGEAGPAVVDRVAVPAGIYTLTVGPIGDDAGMRGDLDLNDDVVVAGAGADLTRIDAAGLDRAFEVASGVSATLEGLEITGGGGGAAPGGGVFNLGTLLVHRCWVHDNTAAGLGGGIRNDASLIVTESTVSANTAAAGGHGGGIDNHGTAILINSTVVGNAADTEGGGIYVRGGDALTLVHSTVMGNSAATSSAIHNSGDLTLSGSILVGDCAAAATATTGGNLESPGDTCGLGGMDLAGVADPLLGVLSDNGGPTPTVLLLAGSPAIDAAPAATCPATDQRGGARPVDGDGDLAADCDSGALELGAGLSGTIFADDFESGDAAGWTNVVP